MATFKLNDDELNFLLQYLPAYGSISEKQKPLFVKVFGMLAAMPKTVIQNFKFSVNKNADCKVACIKFIRERTGWGLKEAKDAFDEEMIFSLTDWKMSKEQLMALVKQAHTYTPYHSQIVLDWC